MTRTNLESFIKIRFDQYTMSQIFVDPYVGLEYDELGVDDFELGGDVKREVYDYRMFEWFTMPVISAVGTEVQHDEE